MLPFPDVVRAILAENEKRTRPTHEALYEARIGDVLTTPGAALIAACQAMRGRPAWPWRS